MRKWTNTQWLGALLSCTLMGEFLSCCSGVARRKGRGTISADLYSENDRSGKWVLDIPDRGSGTRRRGNGAEIEVHGADAEEDVEEQIGT